MGGGIMGKELCNVARRVLQVSPTTTVPTIYIDFIRGASRDLPQDRHYRLR